MSKILFLSIAFSVRYNMWIALKETYLNLCIEYTNYLCDFVNLFWEKSVSCVGTNVTRLHGIYNKRGSTLYYTYYIYTSLYLLLTTSLLFKVWCMLTTDYWVCYAIRIFVLWKYLYFSELYFSILIMKYSRNLLVGGVFLNKKSKSQFTL